MSATTGGARRRARELVFRIAFAADLAGDPATETWDGERAGHELSTDQRELVEDVVATLTRESARVDQTLAAAAEHWPLERLAATDRAVLRTAVAELLARPGTPARVVLDEAIEIAKRYGSDESGRFINGVLDRVARTLRPGEFQ
ncbi:MAG: transcription antitermination factor NusB [Candidatus Eisenbacteria bacterium]